MGCFIANQLPEREDHPPVERLDLWLGKAKDCVRAARRANFKPPDGGPLRIISHADQAEGFSRPLRIHLCGPWPTPDPNLRDIKYYFDRLAANKMVDIEFVEEA